MLGAGAAPDDRAGAILDGNGRVAPPGSPYMVDKGFPPPLYVVPIPSGGAQKTCVNRLTNRCSTAYDICSSVVRQW